MALKVKTQTSDHQWENILGFLEAAWTSLPCDPLHRTFKAWFKDICGLRVSRECLLVQSAKTESYNVIESWEGWSVFFATQCCLINGVIYHHFDIFYLLETSHRFCMYSGGNHTRAWVFGGNLICISIYCFYFFLIFYETIEIQRDKLACLWLKVSCRKWYVDLGSLLLIISLKFSIRSVYNVYCHQCVKHCDKMWKYCSRRDMIFALKEHAVRIEVQDRDTCTPLADSCKCMTKTCTIL